MRGGVEWTQLLLEMSVIAAEEATVSSETGLLQLGTDTACRASVTLKFSVLFMS